MDHDEYMHREYGLKQRKLHYLEPHEMTAKEVRQAINDSLRSIDSFRSIIESQQFRLANLRAQLKKPMRVIPGQAKTTPRKKICRIHVWDPETNTRIRNHKYDNRHPLYKGKS